MPNLLAYEDDASIAELFRDILTEEGYEVFMAVTLPNALAILSHHPIDLIIADLEPGPYSDTSWEGVRRLRRAAPNIPMIVCTGHHEAVKVPPEQEDIGATLLKPFELDHLLELVRRFC
jgi:DNA-binding NtrC family response regulator